MAKSRYKSLFPKKPLLLALTVKGENRVLRVENTRNRLFKLTSAKPAGLSGIIIDEQNYASEGIAREAINEYINYLSQEKRIKIGLDIPRAPERQLFSYISETGKYGLLFIQLRRGLEMQERDFSFIRQKLPETTLLGRIYAGKPQSDIESQIALLAQNVDALVIAGLQAKESRKYKKLLKIPLLIENDIATQAIDEPKELSEELKKGRALLRSKMLDGIVLRETKSASNSF